MTNNTLDKDYKETHDLIISPMSPTYCRICNLSGYELRINKCIKPPKLPEQKWKKVYA